MNSYLKSPFIFSCFLLLSHLIFTRAYAREQIFASNVRAFVNNSQTTVQAILDKVTPKSDASSLKDLTASTAELNVLEGISSNVTAANLNTLAGGTGSDASSLHIHTTGITADNTQLLDNLDSVQFLRSDTNDTFEGDTFTLDGDMSLASGGNIVTTSGGNLTINPDSTGLLQIGTASNEADVELTGDLTVSGDLNTPALMSLKQQVQALNAAVAMAMEPLPMNQSLKSYLTERGESELLNGEARVHLSESFSDAVMIDEYHPLFVKTSPLSEHCNALAIIERTPHTFRVKELYGGASNCPFLWEASAERNLFPHPKGDHDENNK